MSQTPSMLPTKFSYHVTSPSLMLFDNENHEVVNNYCCACRKEVNDKDDINGYNLYHLDL